MTSLVVNLTIGPPSTVNPINSPLMVSSIESLELGPMVLLTVLAGSLDCQVSTYTRLIGSSVSVSGVGFLRSLLQYAVVE